MVVSVTKIYNSFANCRIYSRQISKHVSAATIISFIWVVLLRFIAELMIWIGIGLVLVMVGGLFGYSLFRYEDAKNVAELQKNLFEVNITPAYFNNVLALADTWLAFRLVG